MTCAWCGTPTDGHCCPTCAEAVLENRPVHWRECPDCMTAGCGRCYNGYLPVEWHEVGYSNCIEEKP